jgi:RES domain-containing protein
LTPPVREFRMPGMHRLIPARFSESGTVLEDVAHTDKLLRDAALLDASTNERIHGELSGLGGISQFELVYGIPNGHIIRAAFLHPGPFGARFNDTTRGAWYAATKVDTCLAEVTWHKARRLGEIVVPDAPGERPAEDTSAYDDWQADFNARFHVLEPPQEFAELLEPDPVPQCYLASQGLARELLAAQSNGVVYPSVRHKNGTCLACFRPALVYRPRRAKRYEIHFKASESGYDTRVQVVPS